MTTRWRRICTAATVAALAASMGCSSAGDDLDREEPWADESSELARTDALEEPSDSAELERPSSEPVDQADAYDARGSCPYLEALAQRCPELEAPHLHGAPGPQRPLDVEPSPNEGARGAEQVSTGCPYLDALRDREAAQARSRSVPGGQATLL